MPRSAATSAAGLPTTTCSQQAFHVAGANSCCINCKARLTTDRCAKRLSLSERQPGLGEEGTDQMGLLTKAANGEVKLLVQLFEIAADHVCQLDILEVVPAAFVPGVEVRGVSRQS